MAPITTVAIFVTTMLLFVIFDEKNISDRGLIFLQFFFSGFLPLKRILLLMVQVRKVVASGVVFLTFGAIAFGAI